MDTSLIFGQVLGLTLFLFSAILLINKTAFKTAIRLHRSKALILLTGFLFSAVGIIIIVSHNIWELNWKGVITITGWLFLLEGLFRLLFIDLTIKIIKNLKSSIPIMISLYFSLIVGIYLILVTFF